MMLSTLGFDPLLEIVIPPEDQTGIPGFRQQFHPIKSMEF